MENKIAFCGLNCEECEARKATINNDDELRKKVAKLWSEWNQCEIKPEWINCEGCHGDGVKTYFCSEQCQIRKCSLSKGFNTCAECPKMDDCDTLKMITDHSEPAKNSLKNLK